MDIPLIHLSLFLQPFLLAWLPVSLPTSAIVAFFCVAGLILLSGLFSGSEVAFFSLTPRQLEDLRKHKSVINSLILKLIIEPEKLLATLLIANTFVNVTIVIIASRAIHWSFSFTGNIGLDFFLEVSVVSLLIVLLGEVMPKVYATQHSVRLAYFMAFPIYYLNRLFSPISNLLISTTRFIDKRMKDKGYVLSSDDLNNSIELTSEPGDSAEKNKILKSIAMFGSIDVRQIMKSRGDVVAFDYKTGFTELLARIRESGYSRVPVYEGNFDKVVGILYIKDLLGHHLKDDSFKWQSLLRSPYIVPETKKINDLLKEFQKRKNHMAIVVDEYGGSSGIVTMEDILEEIVGEINDEFDDDELVYSKLDDHTFVFEGKTALNDFFRVMHIDRTEFELEAPTADTLAGFILELTNHLPVKGEVIDFGKYHFKIESADKRRILRVKVSITNITS